MRSANRTPVEHQKFIIEEKLENSQNLSAKREEKIEEPINSDRERISSTNFVRKKKKRIGIKIWSLYLSCLPMRECAIQERGERGRQRRMRQIYNALLSTRKANFITQRKVFTKFMSVAVLLRFNRSESCKNATVPVCTQLGEGHVACWWQARPVGGHESFFSQKEYFHHMGQSCITMYS